MDDGIEWEGDEEVDSGAHEKLLNSLFAVDGKKRFKKETVRGIPIAAQNLDLVVHAKKDEAKIQAKDLDVKLRKGNAELKTPVNSFQVEKIKRQIARETVQSEMTKWEPVVQEIRSAPQMVLTSRPTGIELRKALEPNTFQPRTSLEKELFAALRESDNVLTAERELTKAEERALKAMSFAEAKARRAELMKHHELLSRMQVKAKRIKKIKSKRYRKIARKERETASKKELLQLQQTDPEAFVDKMKQMEEARIEERLTLKHRGGSKFARLHKAYSKFDDKTRDAMQAMLQKSRELTQKRHVDESSDEADSDDDGVSASKANLPASTNDDDDNDAAEDEDVKRARKRARELEILKSINKKAGGWLDGPSSQTSFVYQKPQEEVFTPTISPDKSTASLSEEAQTLSAASAQSSHDHQSQDQPKRVNMAAALASSSLKKQQEKKLISRNGDVDALEVSRSGKRKMSLLEEEEGGGGGSEKKGNEKKQKKKRKKKKENVKDSETKTPSKTKPVKETTLEVDDATLDGVENEDDENDGDDDASMKVTMEELFEDEDVVEQFAKEKAEAEAKSRPRVEDTQLPGWGSWAGPDYKNIKPSRKVQERAERKAKEIERQRMLQQKQQQIQHPDVWLNPKQDEAIRQLQPKKVPFPYTSVQQFEASLRHPVSRGFVRETAVKILTKPEVVVKQGHIIKPLDKDDYFKANNEEDDEDDDEDSRSQQHMSRPDKGGHSGPRQNEQTHKKRRKDNSDKNIPSSAKLKGGKKLVTDGRSVAPTLSASSTSEQKKVLNFMKEKGIKSKPKRRMVT